MRAKPAPACVTVTAVCGTQFACSHCWTAYCWTAHRFGLQFSSFATLESTNLGLGSGRTVADPTAEVYTWRGASRI